MHSRQRKQSEQRCGEIRDYSPFMEGQVGLHILIQLAFEAGIMQRTLSSGPQASSNREGPEPKLSLLSQSQTEPIWLLYPAP